MFSKWWPLLFPADRFRTSPLIRSQAYIEHLPVMTQVLCQVRGIQRMRSQPGLQREHCWERLCYRSTGGTAGKAGCEAGGSLGSLQKESERLPQRRVTHDVGNGVKVFPACAKARGSFRASNLQVPGLDNLQTGTGFQAGSSDVMKSTSKF